MMLSHSRSESARPVKDDARKPSTRATRRMTPRASLGRRLVKLWERRLSQAESANVAWAVLDEMVSGLQESLLPLNELREAIASRSVADLYRIFATLDIQKYVDPALLLQDRVVVDLFRKFDWPGSPFNKREKALIRFWEAERMCCDTNKRVRSPGEPDIEAVLHYARQIIQDCLGSFSLSEMVDNARFGPGATLCVTGSFTTPYFKLATREPTVGSGAFPYAEALLNHDKKWLAFLANINPLDVGGRYNLVSHEVAPELRITDYNKVAFVPKSAETERSIAIEPYFNLYFQLGVGAMIRKRLKRRLGVDLNSQLRNQLLAKIGSVDGRLATLDLSMASDTLAIETVRLLLPPEWFAHLDRLRSTDFVLGGKLHRYHKFSSMGNGFTFELESLIFFALARACCMHVRVPYDDVSVYGDDIIAPTSIVDLITRVLTFAGFKLNAEKSFTSGRFRESCGADFFEGHSVRPVFCKEIRRTSDVVSLANRLLALNRAVGLCNWRSGWLSRVACTVIDRFIPTDISQHLVGPPSELVDGYLHVDNPVEIRSRLVRWNRHLQRWDHPVILFRARKFVRSGPAVGLFLAQAIRPERPPAFDVLRGIYGVPQEITARNTGLYGLSYRPWDGLHGAIVTN